MVAWHLVLFQPVAFHRWIVNNHNNDHILKKMEPAIGDCFSQSVFHNHAPSCLHLWLLIQWQQDKAIKTPGFALVKVIIGGTGTESNQTSAWIWLTLSAEDESPVKEEALALKNSVETLLTAQQKERAERLLDTVRTRVNL